MIIFKAKLISVKQQQTRLRLVFGTKDGLDPLVVAQLLKTEGWVAYSEDMFKAEVEKAMAERHIGISEEGKSDSQILRGVLYRIWDKSEEKISWEDFYHREMTKISTHYRTKYL